MSTKQLPALPSATTAEDDDLLLKRDDASGSDQGLKISTLRALAFGDAAGEDFSVTATPNTLAKRDGVGRIQAASGGSGNETVVHNDTSTDPNADTIAKRDGQGGLASSTSDEIGYDNASSGLSATDVQSAIDEVVAADVSVDGLFAKAATRQVAWTKTGTDSAESQTEITVAIGDEVVTIPSGTNISMPSLSAGTDYAIWVAPDGTLEADASFTTPPTANGRRVGGFHYAPGGNASFDLDAGDGGTTAQINEYSFYDLKWRPSVADPRGLTLVGDGAFWAGIYHLAGQHLAGAPHRHGVNPARDGNPPRLVDDSGNYPDAQPMNIFEALRYHGFRSPTVEEFQLLAFGTNEAASRGSDPGTTGLPGGSTDAQFTSHWGVIQSTGVIALWSNDSILSTSDETLPNPSRGGRFRVSRFASFGGAWISGSGSGSRRVGTSNASSSDAVIGGRGVCDHLILD